MSRVHKAERCYFICGSPRSGSQLLCEALRNTGLAGNPLEYFQPENIRAWSKERGAEDFGQYLENILNKTCSPNRVFGAKLMMGRDYFGAFIKNLKKLPESKGINLDAPALLATVFPGLSYLFITRRNKARQAVSMSRAVQTGVWNHEGRGPWKPKKGFSYDYAQIDHFFQVISMHEAAWQEFFTQAGVHPFTVVYEDFAAAYEQTARNALAYMGVDAPRDLRFAERAMKKMSDDQSEAVLRKYLKDKQKGWPNTICEPG